MTPTLVPATCPHCGTHRMHGTFCRTCGRRMRVRVPSTVSAGLRRLAALAVAGPLIMMGFSSVAVGLELVPSAELGGLMTAFWMLVCFGVGVVLFTAAFAILQRAGRDTHGETAVKFGRSTGRCR